MNLITDFFLFLKKIISPKEGFIFFNIGTVRVCATTLFALSPSRWVPGKLVDRVKVGLGLFVSAFNPTINFKPWYMWAPSFYSLLYALSIWHGKRKAYPAYKNITPHVAVLFIVFYSAIPKYCMSYKIYRKQTRSPNSQSIITTMKWFGKTLQLSSKKIISTAVLLYRDYEMCHWNAC